jgi:hypothetical protein
MPTYLSYDLVNNHLKSYFSSDEIFVFDEIVSPDFHLDVYLIKPGENRGFYTLFTGGVSSIAMDVPDPRFPAHVELMLLLPQDWPFENDEWRCDEYYWPIELIKSLGRFPHNNKTWIGVGHTVPESKGSYLYSKRFVASFLLKASIISEEFQRIGYDDGYIDVLMPIPLYEDEYTYKKENGLNAMIEKMLVNGFPDIVDLNRKKLL